MTIEDIIAFIQREKRKAAFCFEQSEEDLIQDVMQACFQGTMSYCVDRQGNLNGIAIGSVLPEEKVFYVTNCLASRENRAGVMLALLRKFKALYPEYKLEARRHGKIKQYNTDRFIMKVTNLTLKGVI